MDLFEKIFAEAQKRFSDRIKYLIDTTDISYLQHKGECRLSFVYSNGFGKTISWKNYKLTMSYGFAELEKDELIVELIKLNQNMMDKIKFHDNLIDYSDRAIDSSNRLWTAHYVIDNSLDDDMIFLEPFEEWTQWIGGIDVFINFILRKK